MVTVPGEVLAVGLGAQHNIGLHLSYLPDQFLAKLILVFKKTVGVMEQHQFLNAKGFRSVSLLLLPYLR